MRNKRLTQFIFLTLAVLLVLAACREEEEAPLPTALPTAALPATAAATAETAVTPSTTEATPAPAATAVPQPAVDPAQIDWAPQVLYSSPAPGEEALLNGAITVRFDQPMDKQSVEKAFTIEPVEASDASVQGSFTWPRPDTVVFTPGDTLKRQENYRVNIDTAAAGQNGQAMSAPVSLELQTVGYLQVSQVIPAEGTSEVETDSAITVIFNRPVVPLVTTGQQAELPQPLVIDPPLEGEGEWVSTSIYRFVPDPALDGDTTYEVDVQAGLEDVNGAVLEDSFSWRFSTLSPRVASIEPQDGAESILPTTPITITFNTPMDHTDTEAAIALRTAQSAGVELDYRWMEEDRVVVLQPQQNLALETEYQVAVGTSARSAGGTSTLQQEAVSGFRTIPFPAVVSTTPGRGEVADRWQRGFSVRFASPMDLDALEDGIVIDPPPDGRVNYFFNEHDFSLFADFSLERETEYEITIPGEATDIFGNSLGQDYTWRFTTPEADPIASFNLPTQVSQLSTSFTSQVEIIHRGVSNLNIELYDVGLPLSLINEPYQVTDYRPASAPMQTWSIPIDQPAEQAALLPLSLAENGTLPTGVYFLNLSAPETSNENIRYWQNQRHLLVVADTNIVVREMYGDVYVWVTELASGDPVEGRNLVLYNRRGIEIDTAVSDASGFARFDNSAADYLEGVTVVSNRPGEVGFGVASSQWNGNVSPWKFGLDVGYSRPPSLFAYLYTDRPIYRPGDTVYYKGIVRDTNYGRYALPEASRTLQLNVSTAFYFEEGGYEETITVELDELGTFSGELVLPDDVSLGSYNIAVQSQDVQASRTFSVADYRRPEFLVTLVPEQEEALRGETVDVVLQTEYFFGGSAADLPVNWTVYEDTYRPDVDGPFYNFADGGQFFYESPGLFLGGGGGTFGNYLLNGNGRTDENGRLTITLPADLLQDTDPGSRKVTVEASVNDLTNFPVTGRTSVIFHAAETYVGIAPEEYIATAGTTANVNLITVDWDGQAVANQDVEVVFYRREWERNRTSQYGQYITEWTPVDTEVGRAQVTTDAQGKATAGFVPESGGTYVAVATVSGSGGRIHTSSTNIWSLDPAFVGWRTDPKERSMDLVPDKQQYRPGETASILVQSPFAETANAWLAISRGTILEQRVVQVTGSEVLEIPITGEYAPNVHVAVTAVKPVNPNNSANPYADIRMGIVELPVSPQQFELNVNLTPQSERFTPGETAVYDVGVTDQNGNPVQAELSLALVDLAVLTLKEDNAPPIMEAFYSPQPFYGQIGSGLFVSGEGLEPEVPLESPGLGGGGGDGGLELAAARLEEDDVRRDFPDTAYWQAKLTTGDDGRATVEIPLPDSLTTWRLSSKAVTAETLVGQTSVDIKVSLPLLLRPVTPRFFTVGDVVELGTVINNTTGQAIEATASLEAEGLILSGDAQQTVTVPANGQQLVRWEVTVEDVEFADLTFRVEGDGYSDATKPTFGVGPDNVVPVYRYDGEDIVGTSGVLQEAGRRVEAVLLPANVDMRRGSVDVKLSPSLAAALIDALEYNNDLDYLTACAHSVADRLVPNVATLRAIDELGLDKPDLAARLDGLIVTGIGQIEGLAKANGGWGWCYSNERDPFLTAYILLALSQAEAIGYSVDTAVVDEAINFLGGQIKEAATLDEPYQINRQAFFLYVLVEQGQDRSDSADALFSEHRALLDPYAKALLALVYQLSGENGGNQQALLSDLNDDAILSATGAHWEDATVDFRNLSSDVRGTAMVIDALVRTMPANELTPQAVRWLMVARTAQHWPTAHETAWSILALTDWMAASGELDAGYDYQLNVNTETLVEGQFSSDNITSSEARAIPMDELVPGEVNYLDFQRGAGSGNLYYTAHLDSFLPAAEAGAVSRGITVRRVYYDAGCDPEEETCQPIDTITAGQRVRVELTLVAPNDLVYAVVEDPLPSGAQAIDPDLETSASGFGGSVTRTDQQYHFGYWGWWFFNHIEYRDEKVVFLAHFLPAGTYQYTYFLETNIPGEYQVMPSIAREEFFPEVFGRSDGMLFTITE